MNVFALLIIMIRSRCLGKSSAEKEPEKTGTDNSNACLPTIIQCNSLILVVYI